MSAPSTVQRGAEGFVRGAAAALDAYLKTKVLLAQAKNAEEETQFLRDLQVREIELKEANQQLEDARLQFEQDEAEATRGQEIKLAEVQAQREKDIAEYNARTERDRTEAEITGKLQAEEIRAKAAAEAREDDQQHDIELERIKAGIKADKPVRYQQTITFDDGFRYRVVFDGDGNEISRTQLGKAPEGAPNSLQSQAARYAGRLENSLAIMDAIRDEATPKLTSRIQFQRMRPNEIKDPVVRRWIQAERDIINAILRKESGAAIAESEFENARRQYFPEAGDDEATLAQKRENIRIQLEGIINEAGPAYHGDRQMLMTAPKGEGAPTEDKIQSFVEQFRGQRSDAEIRQFLLEQQADPAIIEKYLER